MNKKANGQWLKAKSKAFPITSFAISAPVNVYSARSRVSMSLSSSIIDFHIWYRAYPTKPRFR